MAMAGRTFLNYEREICKLWIEYLKWSPEYKQFCEWKRRERKNLPHKTQISNKYLQNSNASDLYVRMNHLFTNFGDIHDVNFSFDKWWSYHKNKYEWADLNFNPSVRDYLDVVAQDIDECSAFCWRILERKPTLEEFRKFFLKMLRTDKSHLYVIADLRSNNNRRACQEFKRILKKRKGDPSREDEELYEKRYWRSCQNYARMDELRRYLRIYALKKRKSTSTREFVSKVLKTDEFYKNHTADKEATKRLIYMDLERAEKLVENAGKGEFPRYKRVKARKE